MILNFSPRWCSWLLNSGHISFLYLPVGNEESWERFVGCDVTSMHGFTSGSNVELESFDLLTSDHSCTFRKMVMFHKAQKMILDPLNCYALSAFSATRDYCIVGTCFCSVITYFCDVAEPKHLPCICHGTGGAEIMFKGFLSWWMIFKIWDLIKQGTVIGTGDVRNRVIDIATSCESPGPFENLVEEFAIENQIKVALERCYLVP